ncbi:MAG: transcriptional regulator, LysR family [Rhodocyclaceae bacterium]|nr:transcriptional regulator, LysR family [Rhodocyclaceae bacterium]
MTYRLPPLVALRAFESACRHLSFKKAAEELHVTPAAVSQQIKGLESYLGVTLFRRLTRALELTEQAAVMLPKIREGFECLATAVEMTRQTPNDGLRVTTPPSFATRWLVHRLPRFLAAHPEIELRLASSPDTVDRPGETLVLESGSVDLRDAATEVAIRYGSGVYPGYRAEKIFAPDYVPVCSPRLAGPDRPLDTPADLARHLLIHDETILDGDKQPNWGDWLRAAGVEGVDARRGPRFSNAVLAVQAAVDGHGVALAMRSLVEDDVAAGRLVIPFDIAVLSPYAYFMVMPEAVAQRSAVTAFREWLLEEAEKAGAEAS